MASVKDVSELRVYQISLKLLDEVYDIAYKVPHLKLRTQLINSAEAIAPLIAEGFSKRRNQKEMLRFYEMSMAESDEVITHLIKTEILAKRFKRIPLDRCTKLKNSYDILPALKSGVSSKEDDTSAFNSSPESDSGVFLNAVINLFQNK